MTKFTIPAQKGLHVDVSPIEVEVFGDGDVQLTQRGDVVYFTKYQLALLKQMTNLLAKVKAATRSTEHNSTTDKPSPASFEPVQVEAPWIERSRAWLMNLR